ncbi:hypothetical protein [Nostoc sp.]|uniref:hypothetical protein n=1 Tax=Nostoc sp. TaxID=1180 RepID=UPI003FA5A884
MTIASAATRSVELRNKLEVKNKGSLRNRKPRSVDCCALYSRKTSSLLSSSVSKTLVAKINLPARLVSIAIAISLGSSVASTW